MPPPKKVDLLPSEQKAWLKQALKEGGFSGYEQIAEELNTRLEEGGYSLRIGKSALHNFGQEYSEFVRYQEEASAWAAEWMKDNGLEEEAKRHNVLFQMITTLAFKVMHHQMSQEGGEISPQDLHFLGRLMKDVMSSSGMREKLMADERARIEEKAKRQEREAALAKLEEGVASGNIDKAAAAKAREVMGFQ